MKAINRKINKMLATPKWFRRFMNLYGPYLGAGVKVEYISESYDHIRVSMKLTWYNRNYFGTHFGGSLYSMTDPFYCLMLVQLMGNDYLIWDKGASINFVKPGKGRVFAEFKLSNEEIERLKTEAASGNALFPEYTLNVTNNQGETVAEVVKTLYVRKKKPKQETSQ